MRLAPLLLASCFACSSDPSGPGEDAGPGLDSGTAGDASEPDSAAPDAGPDTSCFTVLDDCPEEHPHPGGPCAGELTCTYMDEIQFEWTYACTDGEWTATSQCGGGCPIPPLAELCLDPFTGALEGATVEIGPAPITEAFRPFAPDENIEPVIGAQGGVMIPFRVRVSGVEAPACVGMTVNLTVEGEEALPFVSRVALHCGQSLGVFGIVPGFDCTEGTRAASLAVEVEGLGSASADVTFDFPGCFDGQR